MIMFVMFNDEKTNKKTFIKHSWLHWHWSRNYWNHLGNLKNLRCILDGFYHR